MPKVVDHEERRRDIAEAVSRIARDRGLQGVTFREVAREAGVSVSLVQHYFGSKENLLIGTLEIQSARLADLISARLSNPNSGNDPVTRLRTIATSFIPTNDETRAAMLLYHAFAGAALTDPALRQSDAFRNAESLTTAIRHELSLSQASGEHRPDYDPTTEATAILSLVLGLSLAVLLEQTMPEEAIAVLEAHLTQLGARARHGNLVPDP